MLSDDTVRAIASEVARKITSKAQETSTFSVGVSARHLHISQEHLDVLFGAGFALTVFRELAQPGQYAAKECILLAGPKGALQKVEVSRTDTYTLGIKVPVRNSGDLAGSANVTIVGPKGVVHLKEGLIVAARHLHIEPSRAEALGLKDKQIISMKCGGDRELIFGNVFLRCGGGHMSEFHLDTDEANSAGLNTGDLAEILVC